MFLIKYLNMLLYWIKAAILQYYCMSHSWNRISIWVKDLISYKSIITARESSALNIKQSTAWKMKSWSVIMYLRIIRILSTEFINCSNISHRQTIDHANIKLSCYIVFNLTSLKIWKLGSVLGPTKHLL